MSKIIKVISLCVLLLQFCATSIAQQIVDEDEPKTITIPANTSPQIDYQRYLSEKDKQDIASRITKSKLIEAFKSGKIPETVNIGEGVTSFSIPISFGREPNYTSGFDSSQTDQTNATFHSGGNINCFDLSADTPHRGEQFPVLPPVPKAKAAAKCEYVHLFGTPPPHIDFELRQVMIQSRRDLTTAFRARPELIFVSQYSAVHPKRGLSVEWRRDRRRGETGTQVFGDCPPSGRLDQFSHDFQIYITPPPGWTYNGPVPLVSAPVIRTNLVSCP